MLEQSNNYILLQLEPAVVAHFSQRLRLIDVGKGEVLQEAGTAVRNVYFPETAVLTAGAETLAGEILNVDLIGCEGVSGAFEACGSRHAFVRLSVLAPGQVWRIPAEAYREMYDSSPALRTAVHKHAELLFVEARQFVACNGLHTVENRICRALLDLHDRLPGGALPITQEALAQILGVQRTTVAAAVAALQRAGFIRSGRGVLDILNLKAMEKAACACRDTIAFARRQIQATEHAACEA